MELAQLVNDSEPTKLDGLDGGEINATVTLSEPKQSILFPDKNGLLLTASRRSRNDVAYCFYWILAFARMTVL